jgi:hypothetical protein
VCVKALEHFAFLNGTIEQFRTFVHKCKDTAIEELETICTYNKELSKMLVTRNKRMVEVESKMTEVDSRQLFLMGMAGIPANEPHFAKRRSKYNCVIHCFGS